jgi:hypothetical protein
MEAFSIKPLNQESEIESLLNSSGIKNGASRQNLVIPDKLSGRKKVKRVCVV